MGGDRDIPHLEIDCCGNTGTRSPVRTISAGLAYHTNSLCRAMLTTLRMPWVWNSSPRMKRPINQNKSPGRNRQTPLSRAVPHRSAPTARQKHCSLHCIVLQRLLLRCRGMSSCGGVRSDKVEQGRGRMLSVATYLFGLCQWGCDLAGDLGQPVNDALDHGGVAEVLERVTAKRKNLE